CSAAIATGLAPHSFVPLFRDDRNHDEARGKDNRILFPSQTQARRNMGAVRCRERLGGLLKYYERESTGQRTMGSQRIYHYFRLNNNLLLIDDTNLRRTRFASGPDAES